MPGNFRTSENIALVTDGPHPCPVILYNLYKFNLKKIVEI